MHLGWPDHFLFLHYVKLTMPCQRFRLRAGEAGRGGAVRRYGRIDTWVHLAGVALYAEFERTTPEEWRRVIDVNLNGQAFGAMAALPHLKRACAGAQCQR